MPCPPHSWKLVYGKPGGWRWFCELCGMWAGGVAEILELTLAFLTDCFCYAKAKCPNELGVG